MARNADANAVIELDSSDEEQEPPAKRVKRPMPNAMVSIPDVTIKKTNLKDNPKKKSMVSPNLQNLIKNPFSNKHLQMARNILNAKQSKSSNIYPSSQLQPHIMNKSQRVMGIKNPRMIYPMSAVRNTTNSGIKVMPKIIHSKSITTLTDNMTGMHGKKQINPGKNLQRISHPQRVVRSLQNQDNNLNLTKLKTIAQNPLLTAAQNKRKVTALPSGITIKRVVSQPKIHASNSVSSSLSAKVPLKNPKLKPNVQTEVHTVELDDEDELLPQTSTARPRWYVHPDDTNKLSSNEQNQRPKIQGENKEPEKSGKHMIEITIEDSPVKPPPYSSITAASDLSIFIEDSPLKTNDNITDHTNKNITPQKSSNYVKKSPKSRKKLNYPPDTTALIEVEVEFSKTKNPADEISSSPGDNQTVEFEVPLLSTDKDDVGREFISTKSVYESKLPAQDILEKGESQSIKTSLVNKIGQSVSKSDLPLDKICDDNESKITNSLSINNIENSQKADDLTENVENTSAHDKTIAIIENHIILSDSQITINNDIEKTIEDKAVNIDEKCIELKDELKSTANLSNNDNNNSTSPSTSKISLAHSDNIAKISTQTNGSEEFNKTYCDFIDLCFEMENSEDMKKIIEKKVKEYYRQVDKNYTESSAFIELVLSNIQEIRSNPENLYPCIKDVVDELKSRRKQKSKVKQNEEQSKESHEEITFTSEATSQTKRHIRKLEKALQKLHHTIHKLEEQEVDFDDDVDSVYLLTERYKERLVKVHAKLCQLTGTKMPSEPKLTLERRPDKPPGPALKLEKWLNKKVPYGAPLPFPDFHDVVKCVRDAVHEDKLGWSEMEILQEARDLFALCGKKLQQRRQRNDWRIAAFRIGDSKDPAEESLDLQQKLQENKRLSVKKESELINKFAERQNTLKLEAKEIEENDADGSAPSSDDDVQVIEMTDLPNISKSSPSLQKEDNKTIGSPDSSNKSPHISPEFINKNNSAENTDNVNMSNVNDNKTEESDMNKHDTVKSIKDSTELKTSIDSENIITVEKHSEEGSESEQIKLALSDVESDSISTGHQNLLEERAAVETLTSSLGTSDSDSPIALSDTQDSADIHYKTVNDDVVSIENSSSSDPEEINSSDENTVIECSPSKEKQILLEKDNSDGECITINDAENEKEVSLVNDEYETADQNTNTETVILGENNTYLNKGKADLYTPVLDSEKSLFANSDEEIDNVDFQITDTDNDIVYHESDELVGRNITAEIPENIDKERQSDVHCDINSVSAVESPAKSFNLDEDKLDTELNINSPHKTWEKSNDREENIMDVDNDNSVNTIQSHESSNFDEKTPSSDSVNENDFLSENHNSDSMLDIGPTIIQGSEI